jgi:hypothetical protein
LPARCGDLGDIAAAVKLAKELAEESSHVRHQPECDGIIAADLLRIDVDMDQPGRRDGEGIAGDPRARRAVVETDAKCKQHVGLPRGAVGLICARP